MRQWGRVLVLLGLLVVFLVAIKLLGISFKLLGEETARERNSFSVISLRDPVERRFAIRLLSAGTFVRSPSPR